MPERSAGRLLAVVAMLAVLAGPAPVSGAAATIRAPVPNDEFFVQQWNLEAIGIPRAWDVSTGEGIVVAVLDTGVAYEDDGPYRRAPDLAGTRFVPGWDFVDDDPHPNDVPVAGEGSQGTHVAGIIAQTTNNGLGGAGVAPGAAIMPIRVLGPDGAGTPEAVARGLRFAADHGAGVANVSLGKTAGHPALAEAVTYAVGKGVTVVVAPAEGDLGSLTLPGSVPDALVVGAVGYANTRTEYSYFGPGLDLVAPGGDLVVDQNRDGVDDGIVAQTVFERPDGFCFCPREGMPSAAAHVSGVAALVLAAGRATTPNDVAGLLTSTATDLGVPGLDGEYGAGLVDATRALGMPPLPRDLGPGARDGRSPDGRGPRSTSGRDQRSGAEALFGSSRASEDGFGEWVRRRRTELGGLAALVVVGGAVSLVRRRRVRASGVEPPP